MTLAPWSTASILKLHRSMSSFYFITGIIANVLTIATVAAGIYFAWPLYQSMLRKIRDDVKKI